MQSELPFFFEIVGLALVAGCLFSPYASASALMVVLTAKIADKYFTRNISDRDRNEIQTLKAEQIKLKLKVEQDGLAKAFTR